MKSPWFLAPLMLVTGIAIGWFARGPGGGTESAPKVAANEQSRPGDAPAAKVAAADPGEPNVPGKRAIRPAQDPSKSEDAEMEKKQEEMMTRMSESLAKRQRERLDQHLQRILPSVNLTEAQRREIGAWLDHGAEAMKKLDLTDVDVMSGEKSPFDDFTPKALEQKLAGLLEPDQKAALDQFRDRDYRSKVDALALKNLSQLQKVIDFSEGQRDQVYQVLSSEAEKKVSSESQAGGPEAFLHEGFGIEMDPYDLGLTTLFEDFAKEGISQVDAPRDTAAMIRQALDRRIQEKLDVLRPVLDERQLEAYGKELRLRGGGFLDQMMIGQDETDGSGAATPGSSSKTD